MNTGTACAYADAVHLWVSCTSSLVLLAALEIQNGSRSISPTMPWGVPTSLQPIDVPWHSDLRHGGDACSACLLLSDLCGVVPMRGHCAALVWPSTP